MRRVLVDANVFVSFFIDRNAAQHAAARALIQSAEDGEIVAVVPQSVVLEVAYVVQSQYGVTGERLATVVRAVTSFPGTQLVDECPWKRLLEIWPVQLSGLGDSVLVAVATNTRCDALATFDRKLANKLESFGLEPYF
ncbi:MAG TPA: PIN domain-containing protein [Thermoanaerobaculia bacterium]|jgi:predicted nucleic acid-binding protein